MKKTYVIAALLSAAAAGALGIGFFSANASAQSLTVFDPTNYTQNLLTAARSLQQINNQIAALQNQAQMLMNQNKNLQRIDFPQVEQLQQQLQQIDRLMGQAQGIDFKVDRLDEQFRQQFPDTFDTTLSSDRRAVAVRQRLDDAMASFRQAMSVQSGIVEHARRDAGTLQEIIERSQGAEGSLQASQATNQLLAVAIKQQYQIQNLMASQFRSDALERARRTQNAREARERTTRFLGDRNAYTPLPRQ